jgi:hypothetical protein
MVPRKVCGACGAEKDAGSFAPDHTSPDGLAPGCRACLEPEQAPAVAAALAGAGASDAAAAAVAPRRAGRPPRLPAPFPLTEKAQPSHLWACCTRDSML